MDGVQQQGSSGEPSFQGPLWDWNKFWHQPQPPSGTRPSPPVHSPRQSSAGLQGAGVGLSRAGKPPSCWDAAHSPSATKQRALGEHWELLPRSPPASPVLKPPSSASQLQHRSSSVPCPCPQHHLLAQDFPGQPGLARSSPAIPLITAGCAFCSHNAPPTPLQMRWGSSLACFIIKLSLKTAPVW